MSLQIWKSPQIVNVITDDYQYDADILGLANGNTLVSWTDSSDLAASGYRGDIMGQLYDPQGNPIGDPIFLNDGYGDNREESAPQAVATPDGGFILIYNYFGNNERDQLYRRFDADGTPTGDQSYALNDAAGGAYYSDFDIALRPDGSAVITYRRDNGADEDLLYRALNADGSFGPETEVRYDQDPSGNTQGDPDNPMSAVLKDGRVIVAYQEEDNNIYGAEFSVINTDGTVQLRYNVTPASTRQDDVDVAALESGGFVITWREGTTIKAQVYDDAAATQGSVVTLDASADSKDTARVTHLNDGGFAVAYFNRADKTIVVQTYDANGAATGDTQELSYGGHDAYQLDLSTSVDGRIMIAWQLFPDNSYAESDVMQAVLDPRGETITVEDGTVTTARMQGGEIIGSEKDDLFYGMDGEDDIYGGAGKDEIWGYNGVDQIWGNKGADAIYGNVGHDDLYGGKGNDSAYGGKGADQVWGNNGEDMLYGGAKGDKLWGGAGKDKLWGDAGHDTMWGNAGDDEMRGDGGNDVMYGGASGSVRDLLLGGDGNDEIYGGGGVDWIRGNDGRDMLHGGGGADRMVGGQGADTFVFTAVSESRAGVNSRDVILDFDNDTDTIDLSAIDADTTRGGNQAFDWIGGAGFGDAGDLRGVARNGDVYIQADRNGDGVADFEIKLESPGVIDAFDFIL